ncbi:MAG: hypothetical protein GF398_11285 [Chitinivibrionales bacterium]|nr:hypothetical protein [Chitinivibrionales bacterium]
MTIAVRQYRPADKEQILLLLERAWGRGQSKATRRLWEWKHARDHLSTDASQASIVAVKDDAVCAYTGTIPVTILLDDSEIPGVCSLDLCADPDVTGAGLILLKHHAQETKALIGVATKQAQETWKRILKRSDFTIKNTYLRICILEPSYFLRKRKMPAILSSIASALWRAHCSLRLAFLMRFNATGFGLKACSTFPDEIDIVCALFAQRFRCSIKRDAEFLNWRFCACPYAYNRFLLYRDNELAGYFVFHETTVSDRPCILLLEIMVIGDRMEDGYSMMLSYVYKKALQQKIVDIRTIETGCRMLEKCLKRFGFIKRKRDDTPIVGHCRNSGYEESSFYNESNWYLSLADSDFEFAMFMQYDESLMI